MSKLTSLALWVGLTAVSLSAGTVSYDFSVLPYAPPADSPAGSSVLQLTYLLSNFTFEANQELDIQFDPSQYGTMSSGQAPSAFELNLFQPNNPPGAFGDFSAFTATGASVSGPFSVDVVYFGSGTPGPQAFSVDQFNADGSFASEVTSGFTTPDSNSAVPEPGSCWLGGIGLMVGAGWWLIRHRSRRAV
jgi:hypothetical protein